MHLPCWEDLWKVLGHICVSVHPSVCVSVHLYGCTSFPVSLGHPGLYYVFVRHLGASLYSYLFIGPAVVHRLSIVYRAYLIKLACPGIQVL